MEMIYFTPSSFKKCWILCFNISYTSKKPYKFAFYLLHPGLIRSVRLQCFSGSCMSNVSEESNSFSARSQNCKQWLEYVVNVDGPRRSWLWNLWVNISVWHFANWLSPMTSFTSTHGLLSNNRKCDRDWRLLQNISAIEPYFLFPQESIILA